MPESRSDKLGWFKSEERPEAVLVVADDAELIKIVVAWPTIAVEPSVRSATRPADSEHEWRNGLWRSARCSASEVAAKTGIRGEDLERKMQILFGNPRIET